MLVKVYRRGGKIIQVREDEIFNYLLLSRLWLKSSANVSKSTANDSWITIIINITFLNVFSFIFVLNCVD